MHCSDLFALSTITSDVRAGNKADALRFAASRLAVQSQLDQLGIAEAFAAREALGSTGIGGGVALPHVRVPVLTRPYACLFTLADPIAFDSIDRAPVDVICAMIAPLGAECGKDEPLCHLASMARILRGERFLESLRSATNAAAIRALVVQSMDAVPRMVA